MLALAVGILGLFVGPALIWAGRESSSIRSAVDGLAVSIVVGASVVWLLPHALEHAGVWAVVGMGVGVAVPVAVHRARPLRFASGLGLLLLGSHVLVDGAALGVMDGASSAVAAVAVAAHRIPVGMAVAYHFSSQGRAALALGTLALLTVVGYGFGASIPSLISHTGHGFMEAAVVGVLLHLVLSHAPDDEQTTTAAAMPVTLGSGTTFSVAASTPLVMASDGCSDPTHASCGHAHGPGGHDHSHGHASAAEARFSAVGVLLGILALSGARMATASSSAGDHVTEAGMALLALTLTSAPALLAGFVIAGLVTAMIRPVGVQRGGRAAQAIRGVVYGLPLPICSCGVVPMYQSLIRSGVPITAGLAFLVATPELGLDAVLLSLPLLGLPLTLARVGAAIVVALAVALWVAAAEPDLPVKTSPVETDAPLPQRLREGLRYGLVELVDHTLPWVLLGLGIAALAEPLIEHESLARVPAFLQVPLAAVVGVPLYVCASGATPLTAVAVHKGLSAGAALTFLLAGPASNITTFGMLSQLHGRALAFRFGVALTVVAVLMGWLVNLIGISVPVVAHPGAVDPHGHGWMNWLCLWLLGLLALASLFRMGARGVVQQILSPVHTH